MEASELWGGGKFILGPMVRASSLPLRLAALDYGADVVYSEEIPAHRASQSLCMRFDNRALGTVDFIEKKKDGYNTLVLFRTDKRREVECKKCVLQLGCNDSITALKAAQLFEADVAAIDINMGCSKHYSTSRGMGSALMTKPEVAEDIIKTLRRNLSIPVSVKTRLQETQDCCSNINTNNSIVDVKKSMEWLNQLQSCGAQCVTMHMRIPSEKYRDKTHVDVFSILHRHMRHSNIPLVYNGDIWSCRDVEAVRSSVRADCTYYTDSSTGSSTTSSNATTPQCCCYCSKTATTTSTDSDETHPTESTQACTCTRREDDAVSFMLSRAGQWNPSVFQQFRPSRAKTGSISTPPVADYSSSIASSSGSSIADVMGSIIKHSIATANCPLNTRYLLQHILAGSKQLHTPIRDNITRYYDLRGVADSMGYGEYASEQYTLQEQAWAGVLDEPYCTSSGSDSSSNNSNNYSLTTDHSTTTNTTTTSSTASATTYCSTTSIGKYLNSATWPGIIGQTSHEYSDRYFDDNYYIAFNKPPPPTITVGTTSSSSSSNTADGSNNTNSTNTKRPFIYAGFSESNSTVVRVKRKL